MKKSEFLLLLPLLPLSAFVGWGVVTVVVELPAFVLLALALVAGTLWALKVIALLVFEQR